MQKKIFFYLISYLPAGTVNFELSSVVVAMEIAICDVSTATRPDVIETCTVSPP